jgi:signal transduction histidine kinase
MNFSLRRALAGLWILILLLCVALGFVIVGIFDQGVGAQVRQSSTRLDQATDEALRRYDQFWRASDGQAVAVDDPQVRAQLEMMLTIALANHPRIEGGFWRGENDSIAYAFPTHDGPKVKTDVPDAELFEIKQTIQASLAAKAPVRRRFDTEHASLLLQARPLPGPPADLAVWVMTRVPTDVGESYQRLAIALGILLLLGLGSGSWLLRFLRRWTARVTELENAIASVPLEELPPFAATGERELDRIVRAFNRLNERLKIAREDAARLNRDLARADRLAALGRMIAGLAHEIGNPLAAMRLRAENALAAEPARAYEALHVMLSQIGRLDDLLSALRLLTRTGEIRPRAVRLEPFLRARLEVLQPAADEAGIELALEPVPTNEADWQFDEKSLGRALENLMLNAIQHSPVGNRVTLGAECSENNCRFLVADSGPGVTPAEAEHIFEPFVTTRADGVGLGLTLVREIAEAHRGRAMCIVSAERTSGALFVIEIPRWQES